MSTKYGICTGYDNDFQWIQGGGRDVLTGWIADAFTRENATYNEVENLLVDTLTLNREFKYSSVAGGFSQVIGRQAAPEVMKRGGDWQVGMPLYTVGDAIGINRIDSLKMTVQEFENHVVSVMKRNRSIKTHAMLSAIFSRTVRNFYDQDYGAGVLIQPLANGDPVLYPPRIGQPAGTAESQDDHYYVAPLTVANFATFITMILEHYDWTQGGDNVVVYCNPADAATLVALGGINLFADKYTRPSVAVTWTDRLPPEKLPGIVVGRTQGVWLMEWQQMPEGYLYCSHLDKDKPLMKRIEDPSKFPTGMNLAAVETVYPLTRFIYDDRHGYGVANRLNGAVWMLGPEGNAYAAPQGTAFTYASM